MKDVERILFPTDFSQTADAAFQYALFLAKAFNAELHILHAVVLLEGEPPDLAQKFPKNVELADRIDEIAASQLARLVDGIPTGPLQVEIAKRRGMAVAPVILAYAEEMGMDLLVMGTHGRRGPQRLMLGSVAQETVRKARCPVLTVTKKIADSELLIPGNILVPVDFSENCEVQVATAKRLAKVTGAELNLAHVIEIGSHPVFYPPEFSWEQNDELFERTRMELGQLYDRAEGPQVGWTSHVLSGHPGDRIASLARDLGSDLIVQSTHGRTGWRRMLLGSVAEQTIRLAPCPVLTLRSLDPAHLGELEHESQVA